MTKKKVSFDIDPKLLSDIRSLCKIKDIKLADFFREASLNKLETEEVFMTILVPYNGKIEKFTVEKKEYDIDLFEASEIMKINVGAKCEGILRFSHQRSSKLKGISLDGIDVLVKESHDKKISFYTTEKYC